MDPKTVFMLSAFVCILCFEPLIIIKADEALIRRLCHATTSSVACVNCLKSDPSSPTADEIGLVEISMVCAAKDMGLLFQDTFRYQGNTSESGMKAALNSCLDQFEEAKAKINGVSSSVQSKDFKAAKETINNQILAQVKSCPKLIQSKGLSVPEVVSKDIASVTRDWTIVVQILNSL